MIDFLSLCSTSMGSSTVTMCRRMVLLMWSIIAASVVVLPEPVVPVTSTRPRGSSARRLMISGRWSSSKLGILVVTWRMATLMLPRWRNTLTRKRPRLAAE